MDYILSKILSGTATAEDMLNFSSWLQEDTAHVIEFRKLKSYWDAEVSFTHNVDNQLLLSKIQSRIDQEENVIKRKVFIRQILTIAASVCFLMLFSYTF